MSATITFDPPSRRGVLPGTWPLSGANIFFARCPSSIPMGLAPTGRKTKYVTRSLDGNKARHSTIEGS
jgi:hypothetical protein